MRCTIHLGVLTAVVTLAPANPLSAQPIGWGGGLRPRFEVRAIDGGRTPTFTSMRTRIDMSAVVNPDASSSSFRTCDCGATRRA